MPTLLGKLSASSNSIALCSPRSLDEAVIEEYHEATTALASSSAVPSCVRNIHEFVKLAALRQAAFDQGDVEGTSASVGALNQVEIAQSERAVEDSVVCREYQERLLQADVEIRELRRELVSSESQEAAQISEWQYRYSEEVQAQMQSISILEEHAAEHAELEHRRNVAECNRKWEIERRELCEELDHAKSHAELSCDHMADYELGPCSSGTPTLSGTFRSLSNAEKEAEKSRLSYQVQDFAKCAVDGRVCTYLRDCGGTSERYDAYYFLDKNLEHLTMRSDDVEIVCPLASIIEVYSFSEGYESKFPKAVLIELTLAEKDLLLAIVYRSKDQDTNISRLYILERSDRDRHCLFECIQILSLYARMLPRNA